MSTSTFARRRGLAALLLGGALAVAGCAKNPYDPKTWIPDLEDKSTMMRAVTELDRLGHPEAIPALARAYEKSGRDAKILDVIISMAAHIDPKEVEESIKTNKNDVRRFILRDFPGPNGRPASWDKALPLLQKILTDDDHVDPFDVRWHEAGSKAADAIGDSQQEAGIDTLVTVINNNELVGKAARVKLAAILALGKFKDVASAKGRVVEALSKVVTAKKEDQDPVIFAAAINALGDLRSPDAVPALLEVMYKQPPMFGQVRRALAASGGGVADELRKILRGEHTAVETMFRDEKLGIYCGDDKTKPRPEAECMKLSARDYYAAVMLGDLYNPAAVPELVAALKNEPLPIGYSDDTPWPQNQHQAIYQALQKIGAGEAAPAVKAVWADPKTDPDLRMLALHTYALVARDSADAAELAKIAEAPGEEAVRVAAANAFAGIATNDAQLGVLATMAADYAKKSAEQRASADKEEPAYKAAKDAQKAASDAHKQAVRAAEELAKKARTDSSVSLEDLKASTDAAEAKKKALDDANVALKAAADKFDPFDGAAKGYRGAQRMFQTQVARVEIAIRCAGNAACFAGAVPSAFDNASLDKKASEIAGNLGKYIKDLAEWTDAEKRGLVDAQIQRALVELGKMGSRAADQTEALLAAVKSEHRVTRESVLLALPKVAKLPCEACLTALDEAIAAAEGKTTLKALTTETEMLRNYFSWAGRN